AEIPLKADQDTGVPPEMLRADWTRTCRLFFSPVAGSSDAMTIDRAEFDGDVRLDHPQLKGRSDSLTLGFAPPEEDDEASQLAPTTRPTTSPSPQPTLRDLLAVGGVRYTMLGTDQKSSTIECRRLALATATGADHKPYP